jgi:uncharacterized FlaG/YvyC family protein
MKVQDILNQDFINFDQVSLDQEMKQLTSVQNDDSLSQKATDQSFKDRSPDLEKIEKISNSIEDYINSMGVELKFHIHKGTNKIQVDVIDPEKNKVIRKIPPDELLNLAASIEQMVGVFMEVSA